MQEECEDRSVFCLEVARCQPCPLLQPVPVRNLSSDLLGGLPWCWGGGHSVMGVGAGAAPQICSLGPWPSPAAAGLELGLKQLQQSTGEELPPRPGKGCAGSQALPRCRTCVLGSPGAAQAPAQMVHATPPCVPWGGASLQR